jgi:hypothetical protein
VPSFAAVRSLFIITLSVAAGALGSGVIGHLTTTRHDAALGASIVVGGSLLYYRITKQDKR